MATSSEHPSREQAERFIADSTFLWHQAFELVPGVETPGVSPIRWLMERSSVPDDLTGMTALDVGTTNGGAAFELERRGADRVIAIDLLGPEVFGIELIRDFLGSKVEFLQASVYELPEVLGEQFDIVIFWGVLYHLRHPLLALDALRRVTRRRIAVETAVADHELPDEMRERSLRARFYRFDELGEDPSNWFAPTIHAFEEWVRSAGFDAERVEGWPEEAPTRAMVVGNVTEGPAEFHRIGYEVPLRVTRAD